MPPFAFKSDIHFVGSSDGTILQVYELTKPTIHLSSVHKSDWKKITTIDTGLGEEEQEQEQDGDDYDDDDEDVTYAMSYHGLLFFDGHGKIEGEKTLTTLANHLNKLHLLVNPEGYCFQQAFEFGTYPDLGIHYLRLNDLFSWPRYGVQLVKINPWSRLELKLNLKHRNPSSKPISSPGAMISKDKYEELERLLKKKDEELEKLKEEMEADDQDELRKENEELRKVVRKKDSELRTLRRNKEDDTKRIEELEKLSEEMEEANIAKSDELRKLKEELRKIIKINEEAKTSRIEELEDAIEAKNEELRKLKMEKVGDDEKCRGRIEELEKMNEAKAEELAKLIKEKKNKDEEDARRVKELEKLNAEMEEANRAKNDELHKMKDELRKIIKTNEEANTSRIEELEGVLEEKNEELRKLKREKDAGGQKCRARIEELETELGKLTEEKKNKDEELQKCAKEVEKLKAEMKKNDVEQKAKQKVEADELLTLREKVRHLTRRRILPTQSITCHAQHYSNAFNLLIAPKLMDKLLALDVTRVWFIDDNSYQRPSAGSLVMYTGGGIFDVEDWWTVRVSLPSGQIVVLAYYDGNRSQITLQGAIVNVPFSRDTGVYPFNRSFVLVRFDSLGLRLGFICS